MENNGKLFSGPIRFLLFLYVHLSFVHMHNNKIDIYIIMKQVFI